MCMYGKCSWKKYQQYGIVFRLALIIDIDNPFVIRHSLSMHQSGVEKIFGEKLFRRKNMLSIHIFAQRLGEREQPTP